MDLSKLSDEELEQIAAAPTPAPTPDVSKLSDEELEQLASGPSTLEKLGSFAKRVVTEPLQKPLGIVGEGFQAYDNVGAAPLRATVGALQNREGIGDAIGAGVDQFKAGLPSIGPSGVKAGALLPTTPSSFDIALKGIESAGVQPEYAETIAPLGAMAVDVALDPTMLVPGRPASKGIEAAEALVAGTAKAVGRGVAKGERAAAKAIAHTGEMLTGGHLDADKALKAYDELSSAKLLMPGNDKIGAMSRQGKLLGEIRQAFQENKITVPGSHDVAMEVRNMLETTRGRLIESKAQNAQQILDLIDKRAFETKIVQDPPVIEAIDDGFGNVTEVVTQPSQFREVRVPRDLTLDEIDDITSNFDFLTYTDKGFDRSLNKIWKPALKKSRAMMDKVLQTVPEGALFKQEKGTFENLKTAGTTRGQLGEWFGRVGKAAGILTLEPASLALASVQPSTYIQMMGALRLPRSMAEPVMAAMQSGRPAIVRAKLIEMAEKYPAATEKLIRATALVTGKPDGQQTLTADEAETLTAVRVFDPEQVAMERARIQGDNALSSVQKAKKLSEINERGYITLPAPIASDLEEETPDQTVFGGEEGKDRLMQALSRYQSDKS